MTMKNVYAWWFGNIIVFGYWLHQGSRVLILTKNIVQAWPIHSLGFHICLLSIWVRLCLFHVSLSSVFVYNIFSEKSVYVHDSFLLDYSSILIK
jgi:hypothetical protein